MPESYISRILYTTYRYMHAVARSFMVRAFHVSGIISQLCCWKESRTRTVYHLSSLSLSFLNEPSPAGDDQPLLTRHSLHG